MSAPAGSSHRPLPRPPAPAASPGPGAAPPPSIVHSYHRPPPPQYAQYRSPGPSPLPREALDQYKALPPPPIQASLPPPPRQASISSPPIQAALPSPPIQAALPSPSIRGSLPGPSQPSTPSRPKAIPKQNLSATGQDPISTTLYLDPALKDILFRVPASVTTVTDTALSSLERYPDDYSFANLTTGAPVSGMAQLAKSYLIPPDVKVIAEHGNVRLRLAVVDEVGEPVEVESEVKEGDSTDGKVKKPKPRRGKGRVSIVTKRGGVFVEIFEMDKNRQVDLRIETGKGDVFVLLPEGFHGPIHVTAPEKPEFGKVLMPQVAEVVNPYGDLWTTAVVPLGVAQKQKKKGRGVAGGMAHGFMKAIAKYVPEDFREQDDYADMAEQGYQGAGKASQSKIVVKTAKGKVAFGYVGSRDGGLAEELGLVVGEGQRGKRWWNDML